MITVNHYDFGIAIRIDGMVGKANFIAFACCIDYEVVVEIEEETASVFIVDFSASIGLILTDDFAAIFLLIIEFKTHSFNILKSKLTLINSFFCAPSLRKIPHPATSLGAISKCFLKPR